MGSGEDANVQQLEIDLDTMGNGPRLRIKDRATGETIFLDPLELECLTRVPEGELSRHLRDSS